MPRYSARSRTIESTTESPEIPELPELVEPEEVSRETKEEQIVPEKSSPALQEPEQVRAKPELLMSGLESRKWAGRTFWHCSRCGSDTFDREAAEAHVCKGRQAKPYVVEGE